MTSIFISYRREISQDIVGRIYDRLEERFGRDSIFMDIDTIPPGVDFRKHLDDAVHNGDVLLAVIGEGWLDVRYRDGDRQGERRLDDPGDFVRIEIEWALQRGIAVIPVLTNGAKMPSAAELPQGLTQLAFRNAAEIRSGRDFHTHVDRLIRNIEPAVPRFDELLRDTTLARNAVLLGELVALVKDLPSDDPRREKATVQLCRLVLGLESGAEKPDGRAGRSRLFSAIKALATRRLGDYFHDRELEQADLVGIDFGDSDLSGVSFRKAFLIMSDFSKANLRGADFSVSQIRNVQFAGADLAGANLADADWFNALGLTREQLSIARRPLLRCPRSTDEFHQFLSDHYDYPFRSWPQEVQQQLLDAWQEYLRWPPFQ